MKSVLARTVVPVAQKLLTEYNDFWLLGALTERGFEEGGRNRDFRESVESFRSAGIPPSLCSMLDKGMNSNLAELITRALPDACVTTQPSHGRDIIVDTTNGDHGAVDVKHVYDETMHHYYACVAADKAKLLSHRSGRAGAELFQIVYFVELPAADYPAGVWYGHKSCPCRSRYLVVPRITGQYEKVVASVGASAGWPDRAPLMHPIHWPPDGVPSQLIEKWYAMVFRSSRPWRFSPADYLRDARVGLAIWTW